MVYVLGDHNPCNDNKSNTSQHVSSVSYLKLCMLLDQMRMYYSEFTDM